MRTRFRHHFLFLSFLMLFSHRVDAETATAPAVSTASSTTGLATAATPSIKPFSLKNYLPEHIGISIVGATKGNVNAGGIDLSATNLLTNYGVSARSWNGAGGVDLGVYAGIGFGNIFQLQAGHSTETGFLLRLRSDYPLALSREAWKEFYKRRYWTVTPLIEIPLTPHHGTVFGMGLGRTF